MATTAQGPVTGLIYPPPDIRAVVDKTAQFVAKNGRNFERKIAGETISARFSFLRASDPYHAYYEHTVEQWIEKNAKAAEAAASKTEETPTGLAPKTSSAAEQHGASATEASAGEPKAVAASVTETGAVVVEKKAVETVTAKVAKKLKDKALDPPEEERFKIKHPQQLSALDQEIMYLTAQYTALSGKAFLAGLATREQRNPQFDFLKPTHALFAYFTALVESYTQVLAKSDAQMKRIEEGMDRMKVLDRSVHKLEWMRSEQEKKDQEAAASDAERQALAQIDWHDFVVVETITFDDEAESAAAAAAEAAMLEQDAKASDGEDMDMEEESDDEDAAKPELKVVENYVPLGSTQAAATSAQSLLSVDGKVVPSADANEHMRILLMNPKWREETQRHLEKQKESSYAAGSAIADSLRRFATKRADIFASSAEEEARLLQATTVTKAAETNAEAAASAYNEQDEMEEDDEPQQPLPVPTASAQFMMPPPGANPYGQPGGFPPGMPGHPMQLPPPGMGGPGMMPPGMIPPGVRMGLPGVPMGPPGMSMGPPGMMRAPGTGPPGVTLAPPGVDLPPGTSATDADGGEPATKRQRTDGAMLLTEDEFAALHPVCLTRVSFCFGYRISEVRIIFFLCRAR